MEIKCSIIKDLLPSYIDGLCGDDTRELVDGHIGACPECAKILQDMKNEALEKPVADAIAVAKAKEPFRIVSKKNKKRVALAIIVTVLVIVVGLPLSIISINSLRGEQLTFAAVKGAIETRKFVSLMQKGDYEGAADIVGFWGFAENDYTSPDADLIPAEKERFIQGLTNYFSGDVRLKEYSDIHFYTDDRFTSGSVLLELEANDASGDVFFFRLHIYNYGIIARGFYPTGVEVIASNNEARAEKLAEELSGIIRTYFAG